MRTELDIEVGGMHCESCAKLIEKTLMGLDGIEGVKVSFAEEKARIAFDEEKVSLDKIEEELLELGYKTKDSVDTENKDSESGHEAKGNKGEKNQNAGIKEGQAAKKRSSTLKQGMVYGLVPHIGCIGFIAASILGVTVAVEFFKPLLMNPWFFHILVLISIGFATISSAFYLRKNGLLSMAGLKRKKKYLATMYGSTVGINLVLFLLVFPMLANIDTGSFAENPARATALAGAGYVTGLMPKADSLLALQVNIPCPGHASLISGELKKIDGVTGVKFNFPNSFDVAFDSGKTSKQEILSLEVFETYPATVVSESSAETASLDLEGVKAIEQSTAKPAASGSCGAGGGGCGCGAR